MIDRNELPANLRAAIEMRGAKMMAQTQSVVMEAEVLLPGDTEGRAVDFPEPPFSAREEQRKAELEGFVKENFATFVDVGLALKVIDQERLYRIPGQPRGEYTFKQYCLDNFDMTGARAYQLIGAAQVVESVKKSTMVDFLTIGLPKNERQARLLVDLEPEKQAEVWKQAVETAPKGRVTAAHVKRTINQIAGKKVVDKVEKAKKEQKNKGEKVSPEFRAAFEALNAVINAEILSDWETTDKDDARRYIEALFAAFEA